MKSISVFQALVIVSALYTVAALVYLWVKTLSFGKRRDFSAPRGKKLDGIRYAFTKGMMPWEKESAGKHLPTYMGGMLYHAALLSALLFLFWDMFRLPMHTFILIALKVLWIAGAAAGFALFLKRFISPKLKRLSCPDDFFANLFADVFLVLTVLSTVSAGWKDIWYIQSILLFIYIPFGKIRHCFFFFTTRIIFGGFFGRRGVLPGQRREI